MFGMRHAVRWLHQSSSLMAASSQSNLAKLRKATGYSFSNCRKALELHSNDIQKAEKWLHEQAQAMGWSKATKLEGRKTAQGLVAVLLKDHHGAMVEINCETDFVARNQNFKDLADKVARACLQHLQTLKPDSAVTKAFLDNKALSSLISPNGKTLADTAALAIGLVGENMTLRRAALITVKDGLTLTGCAHPPSPAEEEVMTGKYGCLLVTRDKPDSETSLDEKGSAVQKLCQHVVGMNPQKVGNPEVDKPVENKEDETVLIHQEFLLDEEITVGEFLEEEGVDVVDFVRFECGVEVEEKEAQGLKAAQAGA